MHLRILHFLCVTESKDDLAAPKQGVVLCWSCMLCERLRFREREPTDTEGIPRQSASTCMHTGILNLRNAKTIGVHCTVLRVLHYIVPVPPIHHTYNTCNLQLLNPSVRHTQRLQANDSSGNAWSPHFPWKWLRGLKRRICIPSSMVCCVVYIVEDS